MPSMLAGFLPRDHLQMLVDLLLNEGYQVYGPQLQEGAILYLRLDDVGRLPQGVHDQQAPGRYRTHTSESSRYFDWANGPESLKPLLFAPREVIWQSRRAADGSIEFIPPEPVSRKTAVLGVRACDLAGMRLQDQHFLEGEFADPWYAARREGLFLISVNCAKPADTCFCASTGDGPSVTHSFDLNLTELDDGFLVETGSGDGERLVDQLYLREVTDPQLAVQQQQYKEAVAAQKRALPIIPLKDLLQANHDHSRWDDIAERCLACGNCTQVCPSCFCHSEGDLASLDGQSSEHAREWDSCFTSGHGYLAGFQVRPDIKSRYRQWMTHKLDHWHEQYGRSGCTGCGRCTTWCPAEIDFVKEARIISGEDEA